MNAVNSFVAIRSAAHSVALHWREIQRSRETPSVTDQLHRSLDHLVAVFEQRAAEHLEELAIYRAAEHFAAPEDTP